MENFFKIGEIAKQFKITTRTLRFYEECGLLVPCKIDENKYRLYSNEQLDYLRKILFLKDIGLDLQSIKEYLNSDINTKKNILERYNKKAKLSSLMSEKIIKTNNFELENIDDLVYYGNQVHKKNLQTLCGVWLLEGVYKNLSDAQNHKGKLNVFTPYSFLAFDGNGNSPWFYSADQQKISFDTFFIPTSEIYQIKDNQLFVRISNPKQHIFVEDTKSIEKPHILVFNLYSKNFDDYKKFLTLDSFNEKKVFDKNLVGCWKLYGKSKSLLGENLAHLESNSVLLVENNFTATLYNDKSSRHFEWTKNFLFDEETKQKMRYKIKSKMLILENKTTTYTFTGHLNNYHVFKKIYFKKPELKN